MFFLFRFSFEWSFLRYWIFVLFQDASWHQYIKTLRLFSSNVTLIILSYNIIQEFKTVKRKFPFDIWFLFYNSRMRNMIMWVYILKSDVTFVSFGVQIRSRSVGSACRARTDGRTGWRRAGSTRAATLTSNSRPGSRAENSRYESLLCFHLGTYTHMWLLVLLYIFSIKL